MPASLSSFNGSALDLNIHNMTCAIITGSKELPIIQSTYFEFVSCDYRVAARLTNLNFRLDLLKKFLRTLEYFGLGIERALQVVTHQNSYCPVNA